MLRKWQPARDKKSKLGHLVELRNIFSVQILLLVSVGAEVVMKLIISLCFMNLCSRFGHADHGRTRDMHGLGLETHG